MLDGVEFFERFDASQRQLDSLIDSLYPAGKTLAEAEKEYRIKKREAELYYRDKGYPASMLNDLAKGQRDIADLAFVRDLAQYSYDATKEAVMAKKLEINVLRDLWREEKGR